MSYFISLYVLYLVCGIFNGSHSVAVPINEIGKFISVCGLRTYELLNGKPVSKLHVYCTYCVIPKYCGYKA